jgi:ribosomal protein S18 acetylase RimI-like enzyme
MESSYRAFTGLHRVRLTVEADNRKGVAFYAGLGFREVDRSSEEIAGARLENVLMEKPL